MKDENSVPTAQKMTDVSLSIFRSKFKKTRIQMIDYTVFGLFHSSSFFPRFYTLFRATGSPQLLWNQFAAHSFHRDGGVPPFLPNGYSQGLPWPSGRSIAIKDFSFTSHRPAPSVSGSRVALHCYFFLLHMGHDNVTSHSATKDQKRCSTHGMTFLQGTTSRPIFKR